MLFDMVGETGWSFWVASAVILKILKRTPHGKFQGYHVRNMQVFLHHGPWLVLVPRCPWYGVKMYELTDGYSTTSSRVHYCPFNSAFVWHTQYLILWDVSRGLSHWLGNIDGFLDPKCRGHFGHFGRFWICRLPFSALVSAILRIGQGTEIGTSVHWNVKDLPNWFQFSKIEGYSKTDSHGCFNITLYWLGC